jgi:hypothetical protein
MFNVVERCLGTASQLVTCVFWAAVAFCTALSVVAWMAGG